MLLGNMYRRSGDQALLRNRQLIISQEVEVLQIPKPTERICFHIQVTRDVGELGEDFGALRESAKVESISAMATVVEMPLEWEASEALLSTP